MLNLFIPIVYSRFYKASIPKMLLLDRQVADEASGEAKILIRLQTKPPAKFGRGLDFVTEQTVRLPCRGPALPALPSPESGPEAGHAAAAGPPPAPPRSGSRSGW